MTSFKWKRKIGENVCKIASQKFSIDSEDRTDENSVDNVFLIPPSKRKALIPLENKTTKAKQLYDEGCILAQQERFWEALSKWEEALLLDPSNEKLYEMQSQAYLELNELIPSVKAAEKAVELKPNWWVGYQTLGRAQISLGELRMAIRNFSKSCHINPEIRELWVEDLGWTCSRLANVGDKASHSNLGLSDVKIDALLKWSRSITETMSTKNTSSATNSSTNSSSAFIPI
ncbi:Tetratricopeptide repeat protein 33 [Chamberlinius hualienensis]